MLHSVRFCIHIAVIAILLGLVCSWQSSAVRADNSTLTTAEDVMPSAPVETAEQKAARLHWWSDARFGMFIHWGLYAIPADGEWHMTEHHVPYDQYTALAKQFNPVQFNADKWVQNRP